MEDSKIKDNFYNIIPKNWKKLGEVYGNANGQSMFVCFICLENSTNADSVYNTSDASAFCWHIRQQHTTRMSPGNEEEETLAKISPKNTVQFDNNYEITEPTNLKTLINEKNSTKLLELFHHDLVQNFTNSKSNEIHHIPVTSHLISNENDRISNCNYEHNNVSYTISDDENESVKSCVTEGNSAGYLEHNDRIEISVYDKDSDIIEMPTETENNLEAYSNFFPIHCIPTPETSPNIFFAENQEISSSTDFNSNCISYHHHAEMYLGVIECKKQSNKNTCRPFKCKICGKRTGSEKTMEIHQKRFHSSKSDFGITECKKCKKSIYVRNLSLHIRTHHSNVSFECYYCGQLYKSKQTLKAHIKRMHSI